MFSTDTKVSSVKNSYEFLGLPQFYWGCSNFYKMSNFLDCRNCLRRSKDFNFFRILDPNWKLPCWRPQVFLTSELPHYQVRSLTLSRTLARLFVPVGYEPLLAWTSVIILSVFVLIAKVPDLVNLLWIYKLLVIFVTFCCGLYTHFIWTCGWVCVTKLVICGLIPWLASVILLIKPWSRLHWALTLLSVQLTSIGLI